MSVLGMVFAKSMTIQMQVGVHTPMIRAIEKMLRQPGVITVDKFLIMTGGPDWPVPVFCGMLRLSIFWNAVFLNLPAIAFIVPCVIAGALQTDKSWASVTSLIVILTALVQMLFSIACGLAVAREAERSADELAVPKPEHEPLIKACALAEEQNEIYRELTKWSRLEVFRKVLLVSATWAEQLVCFIFTISSSECFQNFEIGSDVNASFEMGGLDGNVLYLIKWWYGCAALILSGLGILAFIAYKLINKFDAGSFNQKSTPKE